MSRLTIVFLAFVLGLYATAPLEAARAATETVLYSFCTQLHCTDGADPGVLTVINGILYGTTWGGGNADCYQNSGCGTVFSVNPETGVETVLHSFDFTDGADPEGGLADINGTLFGTTFFGGNNDITQCSEHGCGTLYSLDLTSGTEAVLYSFCSQQECSDGGSPSYGLINSGNVLYGTTSGGGRSCHRDGVSYGCGTVFSFDSTTDTEDVLYGFVCKNKKKCSNGGTPAALSDINGILYGTTVDGGSGSHCRKSTYPCGTVFSFDPATDTESTLYSFCSEKKCADGFWPSPGVISVNGVLYGATVVGGTYGQGTVFALDPTTGAETVLYSFCAKKKCPDGAAPTSLVEFNGTLYGTAAGGGYSGKRCIFEGGCGVVFSLNPATGAESVLYSFCSQKKCADGQGPSGLIVLNGTLYGTAGGGTGRGSKECSPTNGGCGAIFSITP